MADLDFLKYFKTPDLVTPFHQGMEIAQSRENAKTQRMFAENQAKRQSAQNMREQAEFEEKLRDKERKDKIEQASAVGTIGTLMHTNPGAAMALGDAYGIQVNPLAAAATPPPATPPETLDSVLAGDRGAPAPDLGPAGYPKPPAPIYEGPQESAELEDRRPVAPQLGPDGNPKAPDHALESLMTAAEPDHSVAYLPDTRADRAEAPAPSNPLYEAVVGGKHYPLPSKPQTTGLGQKYDDFYAHALQLTGSTAKADELTLKMFEKDNEANNIATRTSQSILDRETQREKYGLVFGETGEQKQKNIEMLEAGRNKRNDVNAKARLDAAALMGGPRQEQADTGKRAQYEGALKEAKAAAGAGKDVEALKKLDQVLGEIGPGSSAAAQTAALDTIGGIAQGGKAGMGVLKLFNEHGTGGILDKGADWAYQQTHHGEHSPQWHKSFGQLVDELKKARREDRARTIKAIHRSVGTGSQYAKDPDLAPYVKDAEAAAATELGIPPEEMPSSGPSKSQQLIDGVNALVGGK